MRAYLKFHKRTLVLVLLAGLVLFVWSWLSKEAALMVLPLFLLNTYAFYLAWKDKHAARRHNYRIPEASLWAVAVLGGAAGLYAAMLLLRHKTRHLLFRIGVPAVLCLHVVLFFAVTA